MSSEETKTKKDKAEMRWDFAALVTVCVTVIVVAYIIFG